MYSWLPYFQNIAITNHYFTKKCHGYMTVNRHNHGTFISVVLMSQYNRLANTTKSIGIHNFYN